MININNSISIGICTSNDEKTIKRLLANLTDNNKIANSSSEANLKGTHINIKEIIIVSSGCIDATEKIVQRFINKFPHLITLISEEKRSGKSNALNKIFQKYSGEYLVLIPADACTTLINITFLIEKLNNNKRIGIAFGKPVIDHQNHQCNVICNMNSSLWNLHTQGMSLKENNHASGELMALRRQSAILIPENVINDDAYLAQRAFERRSKIAFVPKSIVLITSPITFKDYINQRKRIYMGHRQLKSLGFQQTVPFNRLLAKNKLFYLKIFLQEIETIKKSSYLCLALIVEFYLKLSTKFNLNNQYTTLIVWQRISVDHFPPT